MLKIRSLSVFAIVASTSVWATGALAGGGGGYALVCNSVSPTVGCSIQQQINVNIVFEQNVTINQDNILNQEVLSPSLNKPSVAQAGESPVVSPAFAQPYTNQQAKPGYGAQPIQSEIGMQSLHNEISNRSIRREIGYRASRSYMQASSPVYSKDFGYHTVYSKDFEYHTEPSREARQMETAFPIAKVKVEEIVEIKSGEGHGSPGLHSGGRERDETIFVDSIVALLGRL